MHAPIEFDDDEFDEGEDEAAAAADAEADRILEEMRALTKQVAAATCNVDGREESADAAADEMHTRLNSMAIGLSLIHI